MNPHLRSLIVASAVGLIALSGGVLSDPPAARAAAPAGQQPKAGAANRPRSPMRNHNSPSTGVRRGRGGVEANVMVPRRGDRVRNARPRVDRTPRQRVVPTPSRRSGGRARDPRDIAQSRRETQTRDITRRRRDRIRDAESGNDGPVVVVPVPRLGRGYGPWAYDPYYYNPYAYGRGGYNDYDDYDYREEAEEVEREAEERVREAQRRAARAERRAQEAERRAARRAEEPAAAAPGPDLAEALAADPEWREADAAVKEARKAFDAARERVLDALKANDPEYRQALAAREQAERRLEALRGPDGNAPPEVLTPAATAALEANKALSHLETAALDADAEFVTAKEQFEAAVARRTVARKAVEAGLAGDVP